jgi:hypothetical protein
VQPRRRHYGRSDSGQFQLRYSRSVPLASYKNWQFQRISEEVDYTMIVFVARGSISSFSHSADKRTSLSFSHEATVLACAESNSAQIDASKSARLPISTLG